MQEYTYLLVNFFCILIPFLASFYPKHAFYKEWKYFFPANSIVAILFLIWDYFFTAMGVWGFNPDYLTGIYLANLPIEEVLFFICIPYACTFTYFALKYLIPQSPFAKYDHYISISIILSLTIIGLVTMWRWYTSVTFFLTAGYIGYLMLRKVNLSYHYLSFILILPFFFMSNGLLTGSFVEAPIVWYNNAENLSFRIGTIPIEDTFYGLLLILLNITLYENFRKRWVQ